MRTLRQIVLGLAAALSTCSPLIAQAPPRTATTITTAPVFASQNENLEPLRVAREGSVLVLLDQLGDWCRVEFQDPEFGRRVGYIQTRLVRIEGAASGAAPVQVTRTQTSAPSAQRGDVAFGYVFGYDGDPDYPVTYPLGIAASEAWRVARNVDVVVEGQVAHGNVDVFGAHFGVNAFTAQGGVRFWGGSRYGQNVKAFGQVLSGWVTENATYGSVKLIDVNGFSIQPGLGVEVPVTRTFAIRPQFDYFVYHVDGGWNNAIRVNVNAVFRLYR